MVSEQKQQLVQEFVKDIKDYPIVGLVNFENLPAKQLQHMRATLKKNGVKMRMTRKKLLQLALTEAKKENVAGLKEKVKGMPALLFTEDNPFTLYATIQKNKSPAPAKAGQTAPRDLVVKAGPTSFAPGPIISELAAVGIKTKVDAGKLTIIDDTVVAKEGDVISDKVAETLKRLDIQPMEIGLDLVAVLENGTVFDSKQLFIDEAEYVQNLTQAAQWAMNLAIEAAYTVPETTELLLQKAFREAKALALEQDIITDITAEEILAKAERQAKSLKEAAGDLKVVEKEAEVVEEKKEETVAEEKPVEEVKEEPVAEEVAEEVKAEEKKEEVEKETPIIEEEPKEEELPEGEEVKETETKTEIKEEAKETIEEVKEEKNIEPVKEPVKEQSREPFTAQRPEQAIPTAESLIKEMKEKFSGEPEEAESKVVESVPTATAESLVAEEKKVAEVEKGKTEAGKDKSVEEAESLYEQLKKKGTLRDKK